MPDTHRDGYAYTGDTNDYTYLEAVGIALSNTDPYRNPNIYADPDDDSYRFTHRHPYPVPDSPRSDTSDETPGSAGHWQRELFKLSWWNAAVYAFGLAAVILYFWVRFTR